jgi:hypothetical protein
MRNQSALSIQFQRKISTFCDVRVAPLVSSRELNNIRPYLLSLIIYRKYPQTRSGRTNWLSIQAACGLETVMSDALRKTLQSGLEAIVRWIDKEGPEPEDDRSMTKVVKPGRHSKDGSSTFSGTIGRPRAKTGVPPKPIEEFPAPLFDASEDPVEFASALMYHMRRHGDSDWHLHRAVVDRHPGFERSTLVSWRKGTKSPRTVDSLEVLSSIERRYRLRSGYFKAKLPHQSRSASGFELASEVSAAERRRLAWHLPDDFNTLPFAKREEILEWGRRVIITGSTDYRRFQATASKQRYAIRFPAISYGGTLSPRLNSDDDVIGTDHTPLKIQTCSPV